MGQKQPTKTANKPGLNNPGDMSQGDLERQGARRADPQGDVGRMGREADAPVAPHDIDEGKKTGKLGGGQCGNVDDDSDITNVGGSSSGRRSEHGCNHTRGSQSG